MCYIGWRATGDTEATICGHKSCVAYVLSFIDNKTDVVCPEIIRCCRERLRIFINEEPITIKLLPLRLNDQVMGKRCGTCTVRFTCWTQ
jgi:hypothetical protein